MAHSRQIYQHLHYLYYQTKLLLPALYRQPRVIYQRLPAVMKKYRHAGSVVVRFSISSQNPCNLETRGGPPPARPRGYDPQKFGYAIIFLLETYFFFGSFDIFKIK